MNLDEEFIWIARGVEDSSYVNNGDGNGDKLEVLEKENYIVNIPHDVKVTTSYSWGIDISSDTDLYGEGRLPYLTLQGDGALSLTVNKTPSAYQSDNVYAIGAQYGELKIDVPISLDIHTNGEREGNTAYNAVQALAEGSVNFSRPLEISAGMERTGDFDLKFAAIRALGRHRDQDYSSTVTGSQLHIDDSYFRTNNGDVNVYGLLADLSEQTKKPVSINFDSVDLGSGSAESSIQVSSSRGMAAFTGIKAAEWGHIEVKDLTIAGVSVTGGSGAVFTGAEAGTDSSVVIGGSAVIQNNTSSNQLYSLSAHGGTLTVHEGAHRVEGDILAGIGELYEGSVGGTYTDYNLLHAPDDIVGWTVSKKVYEQAGTVQAAFSGQNSWLCGFTSDGETVDEQYIQAGNDDQILESSIKLSFADGAFWNVVPSNVSSANERGSYVSNLTELSLDGSNVYVGTTRDVWDNNTWSDNLFASSFTPLSSTDSPTELLVRNLSGSGNFYLRTDMQEDISDSVLITDSLAGSHTLHVKGSGAEPKERQTESYLARAENNIAATGNEFSLAANKDGLKLVDIGLYNYELETSERNEGREWYLVRENAPVEPGTPAGPDTDSFSPTGEAEAALSGLAGHYAIWYGYQTDLRKRLGEVRYGTQTGLWVRGFADKARLDGLAGTSFTQNLVGGSIGYDTLADVDETYMWILGMQIRSGHADQSTNGRWGGYGDLTSVGGGLYSTWVHVDGWYLDAVATMDWYNHEIRAAMLDGTPVHDDRSSYGIGASLEGGRKMDFAFSNEGRDYWFLEPQLQLSWFWVRGGSFTSSNGMTIDQSDMASLTDRAGLVLGKKFTLDEKDGPRYVQPYVKAGVNHEFLGEQRARLNGLDMRSDLDGTRVYYGLGVDWQLSDDIRLYMQAEREHGENFTREYNMSAGLKWRF